MNLVLRTCFSFVFILYFQIGWSQSLLSATLNSTGFFVKNQEFSLEWSIGEMTTINTVILPGLVVTKGVLQPISDQLNSDPNSKLQFSIYPTLTRNSVYLRGTIPGNINYQLSVYNNTGQLIKTDNKQISGWILDERISLSNLPAGTYYLQVVCFDQQGKRILKQTSKILKQ